LHAFSLKEFLSKNARKTLIFPKTGTAKVAQNFFFQGEKY